MDCLLEVTNPVILGRAEISVLRASLRAVSESRIAGDWLLFWTGCIFVIRLSDFEKTLRQKDKGARCMQRAPDFNLVAYLQGTPDV